MAGYRTHLTFSAVVSGLAATGLYVTLAANQWEAIVFLCAGIIGGMLPDLDSKSSIPLRIVFNISGIIFSFLIVFGLGQDYSIIELFIVWVISFIVIRLLLYNIVTRFTVHRGLFHSLPAGVLSFFVSVIITYRFFNVSTEQAWMIGVFIFIGYSSHLILDDIFSAALKLYDKKNIIVSIMLYLAIGATFYITPDTNDFVNIYCKKSTYINISDKLFPNNKWFK